MEQFQSFKYLDLTLAERIWNSQYGAVSIIITYLEWPTHSSRAACSPSLMYEWFLIFPMDTLINCAVFIDMLLTHPVCTGARVRVRV